tara:strand:+ start:658 stop:1257 length:600 start_codon:yes stop_codon:yes gene_type:complete
VELVVTGGGTGDAAGALGFSGALGIAGALGISGILGIAGALKPPKLGALKLGAEALGAGLDGAAFLATTRGGSSFFRAAGLGAAGLGAVGLGASTAFCGAGDGLSPPPPPNILEKYGVAFVLSASAFSADFLAAVRAASAASLSACTCARRCRRLSARSASEILPALGGAAGVGVFEAVDSGGVLGSCPTSARRLALIT